MERCNESGEWKFLKVKVTRVVLKLTSIALYIGPR